MTMSKMSILQSQVRMYGPHSGLREGLFKSVIKRDTNFAHGSAEKNTNVSAKTSLESPEHAAM